MRYKDELRSLNLFYLVSCNQMASLKRAMAAIRLARTNRLFLSESERWIINLLLHVLLCSIAENFFLVVCILTRPTGSPKYGTTRKNTQRYYTTKRLIRCMYSLIKAIFKKRVV